MDSHIDEHVVQEIIVQLKKEGRTDVEIEEAFKLLGEKFKALGKLFQVNLAEGTLVVQDVDEIARLFLGKNSNGLL